MDRTHRHRRRAGAFWLLLLAVVSVLAPVWADSYVCPMAKQALAKATSCCAKAEVAHLRATPGNPQLEPPCDCPKLSWSADATDQVRDLRSGSDQTTALSVDLPRELPTVATKSVAFRVPRREAALRAAPPLWRLNQAILC